MLRPAFVAGARGGVSSLARAHRGVLETHVTDTDREGSFPSRLLPTGKTQVKFLHPFYRAYSTFRERQMDRFLVKRAARYPSGQTRDEQEQSHSFQGEEEESRKKRPRRETAGKDGDLAAGCPWRKIRAESLDCDYTVLFGREEADELLQTLEKEVEYFEGDLARVLVFGKWHKIPRKQATYGDPGLTYTFSGLTLSPKPWIPVLEHIRDRVAAVTGHAFNFVLVNRYKDGCDHIGEHRDDESELAPRSPIASVSFGACRDFFFRHRDSRGKEASRHVDMVKIQLAHGSLLMMNYPTNVHWYHSLPVRKRILAPRVNLTFRNILLSKR